MCENALQTEQPCLLRNWFKRARKHQHLHYACGALFSRFHVVFGTTATVLSILSASIAFADSEIPLVSQSATFVAGMMSLVAALIMGLHTWLRLGERAETHRGLAAKYATTRRRIEILKAFPPATFDEFRRDLAEIQQQLDDHARGAPETPWWSRWRTRRELGREPMKNRWSELCGEGAEGAGCPCQRLRSEL